MRWLVALSLRNRIVVVALGVLLIVAAARTLRTTPLDVFPEFAPPLVEVQTEAPGLSTNDVESLVTVPLEAALNGFRPRHRRVEIGPGAVVRRADSRPDVGRDDGTADGARASVPRGLTAARRRAPPVMLSPLSSLSRVMKIGMTSRR